LLYAEVWLLVLTLKGMTLKTKRPFK